MASLNRRPFRLPSGACPDPALEGLTAHAVLSRDALETMRLVQRIEQGEH